MSSMTQNMTGRPPFIAVLCQQANVIGLVWVTGQILVGSLLASEMHCWREALAVLVCGESMQQISG